MKNVNYHNLHIFGAETKGYNEIQLKCKIRSILNSKKYNSF